MLHSKFSLYVDQEFETVTVNLFLKVNGEPTHVSKSLDYIVSDSGAVELLIHNKESFKTMCEVIETSQSKFKSHIIDEIEHQINSIVVGFYEDESYE